MISLTEKNGLPFIEATVTFRGETLVLPELLVDTGSAGTILNVNHLEKIGVKPEPDDVVEMIHGVGGFEFVYTKPLDRLAIGSNIGVDDFAVELGDMDYGLILDGIIGYDFLKEIGAILDLERLVLR
ncbi:retropepsin-like aspartic protease [Bacillus piscicola]|uniref:retropepsin-like aspartic protease n=1 Tax=Bacillus piscicola TaxID=1632684 RepID=UPI001F089ACE|nr:retropepsin-like aspartic protease [Bacillus piscicola]